MTDLNPNTQKAKRMVRAYDNAKYSDIFKAYGKPSSTKVETFYAIKKEMSLRNGYGMRITGAGSDYYSCAYKYVDPKDGCTYLIYETYANTYRIKLED